MDYTLYSFGKSNEEQVEYLNDNGFNTLNNDIPNDRLFTDR